MRDAAGATGDRRGADIAAGATLVVAAGLSVLVMAHHPTGAAPALGRIVHGLMIALVGGMLYGLAHFSLRRGLDRPLVLAGLVAYGLSAVANIAAATINGFIVPALAARTQDRELFALLWESNQAFATLGVYATAVGFILWSLHMLSIKGDFHRMIGVAGLLTAVVPAATFASGAIDMDLRGAQFAYAAHALLPILVGIQLVRNKV